MPLFGRLRRLLPGQLPGHLPPARRLVSLVPALLLLALLSACGGQQEQARLCRSLLPALEASGETFRLLESRPLPGQPGGVELRYLRGEPPQPAWLRCRFRSEGDAGLVLEAVEGDALGRLQSSELYFLRRFWLNRFAGGAAAEAAARARARAPGAAPDTALAWWDQRYFLQQLLNALPLSGIYALLAAGFMLIHGQIQRFNLAYGEALTAAAYALFIGLLLPVGIPGPAALLAAAAGALATGALFGLGTYRLVFRPLARGQAAGQGSGQALLIAGLGLAIASREGLRLLQGNRERWLPELLPGRWILPLPGGEAAAFPVALSWSGLAAAAWCLILGLLLLVLMTRSRYGRRYRAAADDPVMASLCGLDLGRVREGAFVLGGVAAAGAALAVGLHYGGLDFHMGFILGLKAAVAAILGGLGSLGGALLGGLLLGLLETFWSGYLSAASRDLAVFGLLALVLILRPQGLLGLPELTEGPGPGARRGLD